MDVEIRSLATSTRIQLQPRIKQYKSELDGLKKKLVSIQIRNEYSFINNNYIIIIR